MFAAITARPDTSVSFPFQGTLSSGPSGAPGFAAGPGSWLADVLLAIALRRSDVLEILVEVPVRVMEQAPGTVDPFQAQLAYASQAFLQGEDVDEPLAEFERLSRPENVRIASPQVVNRFACVAATLRAIAAKDQALFDESLVNQLKAHNKLHARGTAASDPDGLIDRLSCGMAVLAQDHGLQLNVKSGYMPAWLVEASKP
jgi:hypothetical protein